MCCLHRSGPDSNQSVREGVFMRTHAHRQTQQRQTRTDRRGELKMEQVRIEAAF